MSASPMFPAIFMSISFEASLNITVTVGLASVDTGAPNYDLVSLKDKRAHEFMQVYEHQSWSH